MVLIGAALFFALGLEPAVSGLVNRRLPRWAAVSLVLLVVFGVLAGAVVSAVPPLVEEVRLFVGQLPHYLQQAQDHSSVIGRINERFHVQQRVTDMVRPGGPTVGDIVKVGHTLFGVVSHVVIVAVLTVYFLADMPRIRTTMYRLVPTAGGRAWWRHRSARQLAEILGQLRDVSRNP